MSYNGAADKAFSAHMTTYIAFFGLKEIHFSLINSSIRTMQISFQKPTPVYKKGEGLPLGPPRRMERMFLLLLYSERCDEPFWIEKKVNRIYRRPDKNP